MSRDSTSRVCLFGFCKKLWLPLWPTFGAGLLATEADHRQAGRVKLYPRPAHCGLAISKVDHAHYVEGFSGLAISKNPNLALGGPKLVERWNHPDLDDSSYMLSLFEQWLARSE